MITRRPRYLTYRVDGCLSSIPPPIWQSTSTRLCPLSAASIGISSALTTGKASPSSTRMRKDSSVCKTSCPSPLIRCTGYLVLVYEDTGPNRMKTCLVGLDWVGGGSSVEPNGGPPTFAERDEEDDREEHRSGLLPWKCGFSPRAGQASWLAVAGLLVSDHYAQRSHGQYGAFQV